MKTCKHKWEKVGTYLGRCYVHFCDKCDAGMLEKKQEHYISPKQRKYFKSYYELIIFLSNDLLVGYLGSFIDKYNSRKSFLKRESLVNKEHSIPKDVNKKEWLLNNYGDYAEKFLKNNN